MNDKLLLTLYVITLAIILVELFQFWGLAITMLLLLMITVVQKIIFERGMLALTNKKNSMIDLITKRLDAFSGNIETVKNDLNRHMAVIDDRITESKHQNEVELEKHYREFARKIIDIENKLNSVKKTLGAAFGSLDERLKYVEEKE